MVKILVQVGYMKEVGFKEGSEVDLAHCRWEVIPCVRGNMEEGMKLEVGEGEEGYLVLFRDN